MDAFLYPELFYGNTAGVATSTNSLFKVNNSHFDAAAAASNSSNKRFVNLNHKIKLNPVEAQKLNSELLKFNYGSKRDAATAAAAAASVVTVGNHTNRRNSNATEISTCSQTEVCSNSHTLKKIFNLLFTFPGPNFLLSQNLKGFLACIIKKLF
jgi:hypothetical protein